MEAWKEATVTEIKANNRQIWQRLCGDWLAETQWIIVLLFNEPMILLTTHPLTTLTQRGACNFGGMLTVFTSGYFWKLVRQ